MDYPDLVQDHLTRENCETSHVRGTFVVTDVNHQLVPFAIDCNHSQLLQSNWDQVIEGMEMITRKPQPVDVVGVSVYVHIHCTCLYSRLIKIWLYLLIRSSRRKYEILCWRCWQCPAMFGCWSSRENKLFQHELMMEWGDRCLLQIPDWLIKYCREHCKILFYLSFHVCLM